VFGLFKANPTKKLEKQIDAKRLLAVQAQRSGDMRSFATLSKEIADLEDELIALEQAP